jgi:hypothetical protein
MTSDELQIPMTADMESACTQLQELLQDPTTDSTTLVEAFAWLALWYQSLLQQTAHPQHELLWIMELRLSPFRHIEEIWKDDATECLKTYFYNESFAKPTSTELLTSWKSLPYLTRYLEQYWVPLLWKHYSVDLPFLQSWHASFFQQYIDQSPSLSLTFVPEMWTPSSSSPSSSSFLSSSPPLPPPSRDHFQLQLLNCKRRYDAVQHRWISLRTLSSWTPQMETWVRQVMKQWMQWRQEWSVYSHSQRTQESATNSHREQQMQLLLNKRYIPTANRWKQFTIPQFLQALQTVERILRS